MKDAIKLKAILWKIQTTVDGGWRVTFDLDNSNKGEILKLSDMRECLIGLSARRIESRLETDDSLSGIGV